MRGTWEQSGASRCRTVLHSPGRVVRLKHASVAPCIYSACVHFTDYLAMFVGRE